MTRRRRSLLPAALALALFAAGCGDGGGAEATTSTTSGASTTAPVTSTTAASTITAGATTTTLLVSTTTTTTIAGTPTFPGDTEPKSGSGGIGLLTDVRFGDHEDYVRIVFDFQEPSFPHWEVAYVAGEVQGQLDPEGGWVEGEAFLVVRFAPAGTADIREADPVVTYDGPRRIDVGLGSVVQLLLIEDFEANLWWAIGLTGVKAFRVGTMTNPPRIYVDIAY